MTQEELTWSSIIKNMNILCLDAEEDTLKIYQSVLADFSNRVASATQKYSGRPMVTNTSGNLQYNIFPAMSGKAAVRTALEAKERGIEIAVGFFDLSVDGEVNGLNALQEVKRIFPSLLCAVVTEMTDRGVLQIRKMFESQDEWLYIKKPFSEEELSQTACNLLVSWNLRQEQVAAINKIKQSQERVHRLLVVTPHLFRMQTYDELCKSVVEEAVHIMNTEHAFLAMRVEDRMEFKFGNGKFTSQNEEESKEFLKVLDNPLMWESGCLVPLAVGEIPLGLLFIDELPAERETEILELFTNQAAYAFENLRIQAAKEEQKMREQELKIGKNIQQSLLPKVVPSNADIELYGLMQSAKEIGGDYYDFFYREKPPNTLTEDIFVSIGDVAGKGVAAGLIGSEVRSFIRALALFYPSTRDIMDLLARLLEKDILGTGRFMSLILMFWDSQKKRFTFTSAGHEHVIHYKARQRKCTVFKAGGVVVGLKHEIVIPHLKERELVLEKDDVIVLFTDGATESMNEQGDMFSLDRIAALTSQYAHLKIDQILNNIFQDICNFIGGREQFDDITMVGIKKKT